MVNDRSRQSTSGSTSEQRNTVVGTFLYAAGFDLELMCRDLASIGGHPAGDLVGVLVPTCPDFTRVVGEPMRITQVDTNTFNGQLDIPVDQRRDPVVIVVVGHDGEPAVRLRRAQDVTGERPVLSVEHDGCPLNRPAVPQLPEEDEDHDAGEDKWRDYKRADKPELLAGRHGVLVQEIAAMAEATVDTTLSMSPLPPETSERERKATTRVGRE